MVKTAASIVQPTHVTFFLFANAPSAQLSVLKKQLSTSLHSLTALGLPVWDAQVVVCAQHLQALQVLSQDPRVQWLCAEAKQAYCSTDRQLLRAGKGNWLAFMYIGDVLRQDFLYWVLNAIYTASHPVQVVRFGRCEVAGEGDVYVGGQDFGCSNPTSLSSNHAIWSADLQWESDYLGADFVVKRNHALKVFRAHQSLAQSPKNFVRVLANRLVQFSVQEQLRLNKKASVKHLSPPMPDHGVIQVTEVVVARSRTSVAYQRLVLSLQAVSQVKRDLLNLLQKDHPQTQIAVRSNTPQESPAWFYIQWPRPQKKSHVHIVIPTRDQLDLLKQCVGSLLKRTDLSRCPTVRVTIIDNGSAEPATLRYFATLPSAAKKLGIEIRIVRDTQAFNFSALMNEAAHDMHDGVLVFLNNDTEVRSPDWLEQMVSQALRPEVGCVGAKLLYPDGTIQHLGVELGQEHIASHVYRTVDPAIWPSTDPLLTCVSNPIAVTAAAMAIRAELFHALGGFNQDQLPVAYNDVDLCLTVKSRGLMNVCVASVSLFHHESISRRATRSVKTDHTATLKRERQESNWMRSRWSVWLASSSGNVLQ
jgi:GT2 family glycosyltransferase